MEHINDISEPNIDLADALQILLEQKFVLWLELSACMWQRVDIDSLLAWINVSVTCSTLEDKFINKYP